MTKTNPHDETYHAYLRDIIASGRRTADRTGTGTTSVFGRTLRFDLTEGFPLITTKRVPMRLVLSELLWFLRGETNVISLIEEGNHIWSDWAFQSWASYHGEYHNLIEDGRWLTETEPYKAALGHFEFELVGGRIDGDDWGELGPIYGKQWRDFNGVDQIHELIEALKTNPDSRRHVVSAWNPVELADMALPPCHWAFQCHSEELTLAERISMHESSLGLTPGDFDGAALIGPDALHEQLDALGAPRRRLNLMWHQRSVDSFLGLPFNIASYAALTHILAAYAGMAVGELVFTGGDCHVYDNHREQVAEQLSRSPKPAPHFEIVGELPLDPGALTPKHFELRGYSAHPSIKAPVAV